MDKEIKASLVDGFSGLTTESKKLEKAVDAVLSGAVKECVFMPSRRFVTTVVGAYGDEFVDSNIPYCSCANFHFKVRNGKEKSCYHLLAHSIASKSGRLERLVLDDEEFPVYWRAVMKDVFAVIEESSGLQ